MSETLENNKKVVLSKEDSDNIRNYSTHFNVPLTEDLVKAMDTFDADPSYKNMIDFKLELCKWLVSSEHEALKDPLWDHPKKKSQDVIFDLQFDKDVEDTLDGNSATAHLLGGDLASSGIGGGRSLSSETAGGAGGVGADGATTDED